MAFRTVLVGCGAMSEAWLAAARAMPEISVIGLADLDPARARDRAAQYDLGDAAIDTDAASLIARLRPDLVFDVAVPDARGAIAAAAFAAGAHLLTEKPLASSLAEARLIVGGARAARRQHAVIQNRRFHAGARRLARFLRSDAIGAITAIHCDFFKAPHFGGFREDMRHVMLIDMAIHAFDSARALAGATPEFVYCHETNPPHSWYAHGAVANAIFELPGGAPLTFRGSWCADGVPTEWNASWRVIGTRGTVTWNGEDAFRAERRIEGGARDGLFDPVEAVTVPALDTGDAIGGHAGVIADFVAAVRDERPPETAGHDNWGSLAMVFAAVTSAENGARVAVPMLGDEEPNR